MANLATDESSPTVLGSPHDKPSLGAVYYSMSGIYVILNKLTRCYYLGLSTRIDGRLAEHRRRLNRGVHVNSRLQRAWRKYGPDAFEFMPIAIMPRSDIAACEQRLLTRLVGRRDCYNVVAKERPRTDFSPVARKKMGAVNQRRIGQPRSPETKEKIASELRGRRLTPEHVEKVRQTRIGRRASDATRAKIGAAQFGRHHSDESRAKMRAAKLGVPKPEAFRKRRAEYMLGRKATPETVAKMREAQRNTARTRWVTAFGETKALAAWVGDSRCRVGYVCLAKRIRSGWHAEDAMSSPSSRRAF